MAQNTTNVLLNVLALLSRRTLVRLNKDEDIVHADGENEERDDFDDDQRGRDAHVCVEADGRRYRREDYYNASEAERDLAVDEQRGKRPCLIIIKNSHFTQYQQ